MSNYNQWVQTAQWVSRYGKKKTTRNDPFVHAATFVITNNGYDYQVIAHSSPYASSGHSFTLTVKQGEKVVCQYSYPGETAQISIGTEWQKLHE